MKTTINWLWNKISGLPLYLKLPLSLPIVATMIVFSFKIAKTDESALPMFQSYAQAILNLFENKKEEKAKEPTATTTVPIVLNTTTLTLSTSTPIVKISKDSTKIIPAHLKPNSFDSPKPIKPKVESQAIDYEQDIKIVNILFASNLDESSLADIPVKLKKFCKYKISIADPVQSSTVEPNLNSIKLPIESETKRKFVAQKISNFLRVKFNIVSKNTESSTVIKIGKL